MSKSIWYFYLIQAVWPHLRLKPRQLSLGTIVNSASLMGHHVFKTLGGLAYATAKMGIISMTKQLAMEGREHGIRVNSVSLV